MVGSMSAGPCQDLYVQLYCSSPAPNRDYHGLTITNDYIILNSWDISHGPHVFPKRFRTPLEDLQDDNQLQRNIQNLFGNHVLQYALQLSKHEKSLHTLPNKIFLKILRLLAANDILRLGQTSKLFFELCNCNSIWKILYRKRLKHAITNQELDQAEKQSWRYLLKKKITEKLNKNKNSEKKVVQPVQLSQDILDSIALYSKPLVHKKRPPPKNMVPKLDRETDFKIIEFCDTKNKSNTNDTDETDKFSIIIANDNRKNHILESSKELTSIFEKSYTIMAQKNIKNTSEISSPILIQKRSGESKSKSKVDLNRSSSNLKIKTSSETNLNIVKENKHSKDANLKKCSHISSTKTKEALN